MIKGGGCFCLLYETTRAILARNVRGEDLQGELTIEFSVLRQIDFTHSTRTKEGKNFIAANSLAWVAGQNGNSGGGSKFDKSAGIVVEVEREALLINPECW